MPKELLIYGDIDSETSAEFIEDINEALDEDENTDFAIRINTNGGSPEYTWGMIAKFIELKGNKTVKNDGKSYSMGLFFNCYVENASALDVSMFLLHRAAYPDWFESSPDLFNDACKSNLEAINKSLRKAFEVKVDVEKFENLPSVKSKGITLDKVFSMDSRIDVSLTAQEAKKIGLINEIITITPKIKATIEHNLQSRMVSVAAKYINNEKPKQIIMTIDELKAAHPATFAQAVALGVDQEKDRVEACMAFIEVDAIGVKEAIASGKNLTQKQMAEFSLKAFSPKALNEIKEESAKDVTTTESVKETKEPATAASKEKELLNASVKSHFKLA